MRRRERLLVLTLMAHGMLLAVACGDSALDAPGFARLPDPSDSGEGGGGGTPFVPEPEQDFTFTRPAVVGDEVFVANETLNSVAVIDSTSLQITTLPVGAGPTLVVGPQIADAPGARVYVLNEGSGTVTTIVPQGRARTELRAMPAANALDASPDGAVAVAWYDEARAASGDPVGDLSSVTLIKDDTAYAIAVGFRVRDVRFTADGGRALILSDDGISVLRLADVSSDAVAPPIPLVPRGMGIADIARAADSEILVDRAGQIAVTRSSNFAGLVLLDIATGEHSVVRLPEIPTDVDLLERAAPLPLEVIAMMPQSEAALRLSIPEGFEVAAALTAPVDPAEEEMNSADMGDEDMSGDDMGTDADMGEDLDMGAGGDPDMDLDMGLDMNADMSEEPDMGPAGPDVPWPLEGKGIEVLELEQLDLGAASVSADGEQVLMFTTRSSARLAVLYSTASGQKRELFLEKSVIGAQADDAGRTFVLFHGREDTGPLQGLTPLDPEFIARNWGISIVDVASASPRLILTELRPRTASLWTADGFDPEMFVLFEQPGLEQSVLPGQRDVLRANLRTFRQSSFRVPSLPEEVGAVPGAGRVFVNQRHPRGRLTFVDMPDGRRQTVTGYQLNAGID